MAFDPRIVSRFEMIYSMDRDHGSTSLAQTSGFYPLLALSNVPAAALNND
jgi:hypothetical protein